VRHTAADTAELICQRCHHVLGVLETRGKNLLVTSCSFVRP
jgi:hypothetical protein